jgi:hypothetical protein
MASAGRAMLRFGCASGGAGADRGGAGGLQRQGAGTRTDVARPASIQQVGATDAGAKQRFPGRLRATKRAELSFNVPGFVEAKLRCAAFL